MGQKDISEKLLEDYNDVFADIVNVLLFDGRCVVSECSLEDSKVRSQYKADDSKLHEIERDIAKYWKDKNLTIALYGLENQSKPEKVMPVRVLGYDGTAYRSQLLKRNKKNLYPVVTVVLYFGMEHWEEPKNLKEVIHVPEELDHYVNDYRIHVFEIAWLSDEQVRMFRSDFRVVAEYFTQMRKNNKYQPSEWEIQHVDEVLKLLSVFGEGDITDLVKTKGKKEEKKMNGIIGQYIKEKMEEERKKMEEERKKMEEERAEKEKQLQEQLQEQLQVKTAGEFLDMLQHWMNNNPESTLETIVFQLGKTMDDYTRAKALTGR